MRATHAKKSLSVVQLGNQNSAPRFNDTLQNKWHILYRNVSLLLQFTVCVFEYIQSIYFHILEHKSTDIGHI